MSDPTLASLELLRQARGPDDPLERAELRDEIKVMAAIMLVRELQIISSALTTAIENIDLVTRALTNVEITEP